MNTLALPHPESILDNRDLELIPKVLNILFKWKWLILTCFVAVVVPVAIVTFLKTPQYQVTAKIFIKNARAQVAITPGGGDEKERLANWPITPSMIVVNSEMEILKSADLLKKAVEKSGYPLLAPGEIASEAQIEKALQSLQTRISVTPVPDSNVIQVTFQDQDPRQAAKLVNTLAALYLEKHAVVHRSGNTPEFFDQQTAVFKEKFDRAKEALDQYQGKDKIIDVTQEVTLNLGNLSRFEETLKNLQGEIDGGEKEIATLDLQIKQQPDQIPTQKTVMLNPEVTAITLKIAELERQRGELLQRYTPKSRFVIDKENEIAALRKQLEGTQTHIAGDSVIAQNHVRETLTQQFMQKKALLDSLKAKKRALVQEIAPYQARLNLLKSKSIDLERLQQEYNAIRDSYILFRKKTEESRVSSAMDEEKLVNVGIMQQADVPVLSLGRGLLLAAILASVAGLALGVGIAFALEFFNLTIKSEDDVGRFLGVPVLATIRQF